MYKRIFPITQGVACQLKWTWNTLKLQNGSSKSCHRVKSVTIDPDQFDNFHNHQTWLDHRKMMLDGKFPSSGCDYCEKIESAGGVSDRLASLQIPDLTPPELDHDLQAVHVTPRILEVYLDNICNMSCIYCSETDSSKIQIENKKFGNAAFTGSGITIPTIKSNNNSQQYVEKFFDYLKDNCHNLKRLHILGGEPFYQKNFERVLDFLKQNKNPSLQLNIVTNLMVAENKLLDFVDLAKYLIKNKQIQRLDITASIDCFGPEQEYVRYGLNLDRFLKNFSILVSHKWITLHTNSTITSLTIKTMPDMLKYMHDIKKYRKLNTAFGLVVDMPWLHPDIFPGDFFKSDFDKIIDCMSDASEWDSVQKQYMVGIAKQLEQSNEDSTKIKDLKIYLDELDRRRGLSWQQTFPWLDQYLLTHNHVV